MTIHNENSMKINSIGTMWLVGVLIKFQLFLKNVQSQNQSEVFKQSVSGPIFAQDMNIMIGLATSSLKLHAQRAFLPRPLWDRGSRKPAGHWHTKQTVAVSGLHSDLGLGNVQHWTILRGFCWQLHLQSPGCCFLLPSVGDLENQT